MISTCPTKSPTIADGPDLIALLIPTGYVHKNRSLPISKVFLLFFFIFSISPPRYYRRGGNRWKNTTSLEAISFRSLLRSLVITLSSIFFFLLHFFFCIPVTKMNLFWNQNLKIWVSEPVFFLFIQHFLNFDRSVAICKHKS